MNPAPVRSFRFDDFEIDLPTRRLLRDGEALPIEPRVLDVLVFLVEHCDRLVEKQELIDVVWEGAFVTDNALSRTIARLRKVLGDDAQHPRFIETAHGHGYRFLAEVDVSLPDDGAPRGEPASRPGVSRSGVPPRGAPSRGLVITASLVLIAAALVTLGLLLDGPASRPPPVPTLDRSPLQLTSSKGLESWPSLSPDGSAVVYFADRDGEPGLYVRSVEEGARETPLLPPGEIGTHPAWSPDGAQIAYRGRGGIWLISALGGTARQLTDFGSVPAWTPDGRSLVFQEAAGGGSNPDSPMTTGPSTLWRIDLVSDDAIPRQLTEPGRPEGAHGGAAVSPDGRRMAFVAVTQGRGSLWTVDLDGGDPVPLSDHRAAGRPRWDADGQGLYFTGHLPGDYGVWYLPVSVDGREATGEPSHLLEGRFRHLSTSADGRRLAVTRLTLDSDLYSVRLDPETLSPDAEPEPLTQGTDLRMASPAFSPDGRRLAWLAAREGQPIQLWMMELEGGGRTLLASEPGANLSLPSWSEDSTSVAFAVRDPAGDRALLREANVETRRVETLLELEGSWEWPRLSPDGRSIAFHRRIDGRPAQVWVAAIDGSDARPLTSFETFAGFVTWSRNGRRLAFQLQVGDGTQIGVIPVDGGAPEVLTSGPGTRWGWSWGPDDEAVAFAGHFGDGWSIFALPLDGREAVRLTPELRHGFVRYPAWSPRGERIVYERSALEGDVYVVDLAPPANGQP